MIEIVKVVAVKPREGYRLAIQFSDASGGEHDFSDLIETTSPMTDPLRDPAYFGRVFIELGVLAWPNGLELDSIELHRRMLAAGELHRIAAQ